MEIMSHTICICAQVKLPLILGPQYWVYPVCHSVFSVMVVYLIWEWWQNKTSLVHFSTVIIHFGAKRICWWLAVILICVHTLLKHAGWLHSSHKQNRGSSCSEPFYCVQTCVSVKCCKVVAAVNGNAYLQSLRSCSD